MNKEKENDADLVIFKKIIKSCYGDCSMERLMNNECFNCEFKGQIGEGEDCIMKSIMKKGFKVFSGAKNNEDR